MFWNTNRERARKNEAQRNLILECTKKLSKANRIHLTYTLTYKKKKKKGRQVYKHINGFWKAKREEKKKKRKERKSKETWFLKVAINEVIEFNGGDGGHVLWEARMILLQEHEREKSLVVIGEEEGEWWRLCEGA